MYLVVAKDAPKFRITLEYALLNNICVCINKIIQLSTKTTNYNFVL